MLVTGAHVRMLGVELQQLGRALAGIGNRAGQLLQLHSHQLPVMCTLAAKRPKHDKSSFSSC